MNRNLTVVIQAGGRSSRMGQDKALVNLGGKPLIEHLIESVDSIADDIVIITNNKPAFMHYGLRLVSDKNPGAGALPGLQTALQASSGTHMLLVACDMPFASRPLLEFQVEQAIVKHADVVVPRWDHHLQTMHAVYRRDTCLAAVTDALATESKRMISFYPDVLVHILEPEDISEFTTTGRPFFNVNTPADLAEAEKMLY